jgi:Response regulator containing CheY-like receiver, AAA-type ATPase, and DNA-binding domains
MIRSLVNWWRTESRERIPVLAITPDERDKTSLSAFSVRGQWDLVWTSSCEEALELLKKLRVAVILCDRDLPGVDWRDALQKLAASRPDCPILLTSSVNDEYLWDEVIHKGGYDVLSKPLQGDQTVRAVNLAWSYSKQRARA